LTTFTKSKEPKDRVTGWIEIVYFFSIAEIVYSFDFTVEYRPGPKHGNGEAMFRL
jgi:hypothetical protein